MLEPKRARVKNAILFCSKFDRNLISLFDHEKALGLLIGLDVSVLEAILKFPENERLFATLFVDAIKEQ